MRRYSEAVKAEIRKPDESTRSAERNDDFRASGHSCCHSLRLAQGLAGEAVPASHKGPEGWNAADTVTLLQQTAGRNATELLPYCRGLYPEQVERWRPASQEAKEKPVLALKDPRDLMKLRGRALRETKWLQKELLRSEKAYAEAAALLAPSVRGGRGRCEPEQVQPAQGGPSAERRGAAADSGGLQPALVLFLSGRPACRQWGPMRSTIFEGALGGAWCAVPVLRHPWRWTQTVRCLRRPALAWIDQPDKNRTSEGLRFIQVLLTGAERRDHS